MRCGRCGIHPSTDAIALAIERAHRDEWARIVATLIRVTGDWSLAEDCTQDAFATALTAWRDSGIPANTGAWLTTTARNRAIDVLRRRTTEREKVSELVNTLNHDEATDDRLGLVFTCCHPALPIEARVALTLRTVAGLTTGEIARAFLVPEPTMAQRLVRAKSKIANAGIPYRVPEAELLGERLPGVLAVLYVLFTEGYSATSGDQLVRADLADEAIRLARLLALLMPSQPEVGGLLALMLLQHSRRDARTDAQGDLISLEQQNRSLWYADEISEGVATLQRALRQHRVDRYQLQAVIAAAHAVAPSAGETDFRGIVRAYDDLARMDPSPIIALNRAIAWGMWAGAEVGLERVNLVADSLDGYYLVAAARADFLRRLGRHVEAAEQYSEALTLVRTDPERRYLERRRAESLLDGGGARG